MRFYVTLSDVLEIFILRAHINDVSSSKLHIGLALYFCMLMIAYFGFQDVLMRIEISSCRRC